MSTIDDLIARANMLVHGIDWDALDSQSRGVPLDPKQDAHLDYWTVYLAPAFNRAADVMNTLYYDPIIVNRADTEVSLSNIWGEFEKASPYIWDNVSLVANPVTYMKMALTNPLVLNAEPMRNVISYVWGVIMFGVKLHTTFMIASQGRATMRAHADHIVRLCEAIALLDQAGALSQLKWNSDTMVKLRASQGVSALQPFTPPVSSAPATSGLGANGLGIVVPVLGIVVAVLGAAVLFYGIYKWSTVTTEVNKATLETTKQLCSDPTYANDEASRAGCVKVLGDALAETTKVKLPSAIMTYVFYAALIAGGIYFAPFIVRSFMGAKKELRTT